MQKLPRSKWSTAETALTLLLTSSEMKSFLHCRRGWWLDHYRCLRRRQQDFPSLPDIGNHFHAGLEAYYKGDLKHPSELVASRAAFNLKRFPELADQISKSAELATIMLDGYIEWVEEEGRDADLEFVAAEQTVEVSVGPYRLRGKIDARFRRRSDGALVQLEHKTCGNLTDHPVWAQSNPQFLTYGLLSMLTKPDGVRTDGVTVNMARRVKRTVKAKPPFYDRFHVPHSDQELRSHYLHVVGIGRMIERARAELDSGESHHVVCPPYFNRNHSWSCSCAALDTMPDENADLEGYLADFYEAFDPNERYLEVSK